MSGSNGIGRPTRRRALASIGTVAVTALAGCRGSDDGSDDVPDFEVDEDAPARLRLLGVDFPGDLTFGDTFDGEITFANTGGEPIESNASVSVVRLTADDVSPQRAEVNSEGLESGESGSHSIGQFTAAAAGDYRLEIGSAFDAVHDDVEQGFSVAQQTAAVGEQVTTPDDLRVTVTGIEYSPALLSRSGDSFSLRSPLDDRIVALPQVTVENAGSDGRRIDPDTFTVGSGSRVTGLSPVAFDAPDLRGVQINPGESIEGWIAATIDRSEAGSVDVGLNAASAEAPADVSIAVDGDASLPAFELVDTQVPSAFQSGDQEFAFTVENTGDAPGTFQGFVEYMYTEEPGLFSTRSAHTWYSDFGEGLVAEIPPGETLTVSEVTTYDDDLDVTYRLEPFEFSVDA